MGPRQDFLVDRLRGKRVLHVGCVDAGLLESRYESGHLLHLRLLETTSELTGIDVDEDGIAYLQSRGVPNLITADICEPSTFAVLEDFEPDVILASEVIEHLADPGRFLDALHRFASPSLCEVLVTVPNAFGLRAVGGLFRRREKVHPDHFYWFSFSTIRTLLSRHGFEPVQTWVYSFEPIALLPSAWRAGPVLRLLLSLPRRLFVRAMYAITPFWADGIIVSARPRP